MDISRREFVRQGSLFVFAATFVLPAVACENESPLWEDPFTDPTYPRYEYWGIAPRRMALADAMAAAGRSLTIEYRAVTDDPRYGGSGRYYESQSWITKVDGRFGNWRFDVNGSWFGNGPHIANIELWPGEQWGCWRV